MGDEEKSYQYHKKAAQMNPYVSSYQQNYVSILYRTKRYDEKGDYDNAMKNYQKADDLSIPGSPAQKEIEKLVDILDEKYQLVDLK